MIYDFDDLKKHIGHKIACVRLSGGGEASKVVLRCNDCNVRLVDLSPGDVLSKTTADALICPGWSISDVVAQAKENDINLSDQQAREILQQISDKMDASVGINWDVIDYRIDKYLNDMSG